MSVWEINVLASEVVCDETSAEVWEISLLANEVVWDKINVKVKSVTRYSFEN